MVIKRIHIASFGPLVDFDCELYAGMNIIRGENESGKTSLAMFIKFIFYGLSGRSVDGSPSERKKYVNWDTGYAEGFITVTDGDKEYRIERSLAVSTKVGSDKETVRESLTVTDTATGGRVPELEECPGMTLFGVPEQVFVNTVFATQSGRAHVDGADTATAVENLLFSADETVSVKKAAERLEKYRRTLLHKKGSGGEIPALREKCTELKSRLEEASSRAQEIIELENAVSLHEKMETTLVSDIEERSAALRYFEAEKLCAKGGDARRAEAAADAAKTELREALSRCIEPSKLDEGRRLVASVESERTSAAVFEDRLRELEVGAASLVKSDMPDNPGQMYDKFKAKESAARSLGTVGVVTAILAGLAGVGAAVLFWFKSQAFLFALAGAVIMLLVSILFFVLRAKKVSGMRDICAMFGAEDEGGLVSAINHDITRRDEASELTARASSVKMSLVEAGIRIETLLTEADALAASFEDCCAADTPASAGKDPLIRLKSAISLAESRISHAESLRTSFETAVGIAKAKWENVPKDRLAVAVEYIRNNEKREGFPSNEGEADDIRNKLAFDQAKIDVVRKKLHTMEVDLASKRAASENPAEIWEELSESTARLRRLTLDHDAVLLAAETLAEAGENMRRGIIPKIVRRASVLFASITEGRYSSLGSGNTFALSAVLGEHTRDAAFLSSGTEDLAYVCLRIALAAELLEKNVLRLFSTRALLSWIPTEVSAKEALENSGHQVLFFTCRPIDAGTPTLRMFRK